MFNRLRSYPNYGIGVRLGTFSLVFLICALPFSFAQSPSSKSMQMDPDWEKIRDAQVQMLKKKEADLDRMKEELLARAVPQSQIQAGLPEIEGEFKKREAEWTQKSNDYENEITLLKVKIEEQKKEIEDLRSQYSGNSPKQISSQVEKITNQNTEQVKAVSAQSKELEKREAQLKLREKQLVQKQAEWELTAQQSKQSVAQMNDLAARLEKSQADLQKQKEDLAAAQFHLEQKTQAEASQLESDRRALETLRQTLAVDKASLENQKNDLALKLKHAQVTDSQSQALVAREKEIQKREALAAGQEREFALRQADLEERAKRIEMSQKKLVDEKRVWSQRAEQMDSGLKDKLSAAEARAIQLQQSFQAEVSKRIASEKLIIELKNQLQEGKNASAEREINWKKREQDLLQMQSKVNDQARQSQQRLGQVQANASQNEIESKNQIAGLNLKLTQTEKKLSEAEFRLQQAVSQPKQMLRMDQPQNLTQKKFDQIEKENQYWRGQKKQIDENWADFVNKEMQYQLEIEDLKKTNQALQKQIEGQSGAAEENEGRDWSAEARKVVEERRDLGNEKALLYQQLKLDRHELERARVELNRRQKDFDRHIQAEEARLQKLRKQAGAN